MTAEQRAEVRLTDDEREVHGRRAGSFPAAQLVYSLTDVEMILRKRLSGGCGVLSRDESVMLTQAAHERDVTGSGCSCEEIIAAVERILADRAAAEDHGLRADSEVEEGDYRISGEWIVQLVDGEWTARAKTAAAVRLALTAADLAGGLGGRDGQA